MRLRKELLLVVALGLGTFLAEWLPPPTGATAIEETVLNAACSWFRPTAAQVGQEAGGRGLGVG